MGYEDTAYGIWSDSRHGAWVRGLADNVLDGRRDYREAVRMIRESGSGLGASQVPPGGVGYALDFLATVYNMDVAEVRTMGQSF